MRDKILDLCNHMPGFWRHSTYIRIMRSRGSGNRSAVGPMGLVYGRDLTLVSEKFQMRLIANQGSRSDGHVTNDLEWSRDLPSEK